LFERYVEKHRAIGVQSAAEAAHLLDTIHPTALVLDEAQPYDDIRVLAEQQAIPLIECPMPSGRRSMKAYGVTDYLVKPVSSEALHDTLRRLDRPVQSIVVIDDDQDVVRLYDRMLRTLSPIYQVRKAYSALEGLEIMKYTPPNVVILDLLMPEVDGFAVIREMKATPALADIPIILASAYGAADAIAPHAKGRLSVFRTDGFQPIELVQCVERLVDVLTPASGPVRSETRPVPAAS
jgi:CheY-like chemotaxis protein